MVPAKPNSGRADASADDGLHKHVYRWRMCGITGYRDLTVATPEADLRANGLAMAAAIRHRGPDQGEVWVDPAAGIVLAFRRLAIIDLSDAGAQPMTSADGRFVMTYNGEIYNYRDLRAELEATGHSFRGHSDSEVILELFARQGIEAALPRLVGMFAIALWDRRERRLAFARDRLGIKPLYLAQQGQSLFWGSELKTLRAHPAFRAEVSLTAMDGFLKGNVMAAPDCIYQDVCALEPGMLVLIDAQGTRSDHCFWSLEAVAAQSPSTLDETEALAELTRRLEEAVQMRMVADVPLGALLSGGIDSSTVVALMQRASDRPVKTFTIGFGSTDHDEATQAAAVAAHLGTEHTALSLSATDARGLIENLPDWYDEPFADSSALPTYLVSRLAKETVTVALSGDGGDEVFFGYNRHRALAALSRKFSDVPGPLRKAGAGLIASLGPAFWDRAARILPGNLRPPMFGNKAMKLARALEAESDDARYLSTLTHWPEDLTGLGRTASVPANTPLGLRDPAARAAWIDTRAYLPNDILTKVDRASMAVSLEARVPLLDHRVVEFAWTLPTHMKIRNGVQKWALRQVLYQYVPQSLVDRPKAGFAIPLAEWLRADLRDWAETLLCEKRLRQRGWLDPGPIRQAWRDHLAGKGERQEALWGVCMLEAWAERWMGLP